MGFTTVPDALRAAGQAGKARVAELRGADCGKPVTDVAAALPGGKAAGASSGYATAWSEAFAAWCTAADQHATALATAADTYVAGDHTAGQSLPDEGKMTGPR